MKKRYFIITLLLFVILITITSCIVDEYKINEITLEDEWSMDIIVPLLKGDLTITNFIDESEYKDNNAGNDVEIQYSNTQKFVDRSKLCAAYFENIDYDLTIIEGQEYLDSATLILIAKNDFNSRLLLTITFKDELSNSQHSFVFNVPKNSDHSRVETEVPTSAMRFIQSFTKVDIQVSFRNCNSSFTDNPIEIEDQFKFTLILNGIIKKYNNLNE